MGGCSICGKVLIGTSSSAVCYDCSGKTYMYHPCAGCIEKDKRIAELEQERDEALELAIALSAQVAELETILGLHNENVEKNGVAK